MRQEARKCNKSHTEKENRVTIATHRIYYLNYVLSNLKISLSYSEISTKRKIIFFPFLLLTNEITSAILDDGFLEQTNRVF